MMIRVRPGRKRPETLREFRYGASSATARVVLRRELCYGVHSATGVIY